MHSWWYDQVGNDTLRDPWIDEPLTQWSTLYVFERLRGRKAMEEVAGQRLMGMIGLGDMAPMTTSGDAWASIRHYGVLLYCRAPLMYEVLRQRVGDQRFFATLRDFYRQHAGGLVGRAQWDASFLALLPATERQAFVSRWIEGVDEPVPSDLDPLFTAVPMPGIRDMVAEYQAKLAAVSAAVSRADAMAENDAGDVDAKEPVIEPAAGADRPTVTPADEDLP